MGVPMYNTRTIVTSDGVNRAGDTHTNHVVTTGWFKIHTPPTGVRTKLLEWKFVNLKKRRPIVVSMFNTRTIVTSDGVNQTGATHTSHVVTTGWFKYAHHQHM